jgi:seryl-tRNA synthetase
VTGQVADLGAQVSALEAARTQLEALFARAGTIQALLSVQNEITSVQSQIQQLQAQQRVLANEISFSSLTVARAMPRATHASAPSRFSKAWHQAVSHVEGGLSTLLADSGIVLFSVVLLIVLGLLVLFGGRLLWSFVRRRLV